MYKKKKYRTAGQVTDDNTIRRMRFACWIPKAHRHTFIICYTYCFPTSTTVTRTRLDITFIGTLPVLLFVHVLHTLVAGLLARSQYPEGPTTGHLGIGFSWFPCV